MTKRSLTRRELIGKAAVAGVAIGLGGLIIGCESEKKPAAAPTPPKADKKPAAPAKPAGNACDDVSKLTDAEKSGRTGLKYTSVTPKPDQDCANCNFYKDASPCGTCTLIKGPIAAKGWCSAWVKKA